jgi:hypothetical protein
MSRISFAASAKSKLVHSQGGDAKRIKRPATSRPVSVGLLAIIALPVLLFCTYLLSIRPSALRWGATTEEAHSILRRSAGGLDVCGTKPVIELGIRSMQTSARWL